MICVLPPSDADFRLFGEMFRAIPSPVRVNTALEKTKIARMYFGIGIERSIVGIVKICQKKIEQRSEVRNSRSEENHHFGGLR